MDTIVLRILLAAAGGEFEDIGRWVIAAGAVLVVVTFVFSYIRWLDDRFVTRREWDRVINEQARTEKLADRLAELVARLKK